MDIILNLLSWQGENLISPKNIIIYAVGLVVIYVVFWIIYKIQGMQYLNPTDREFSLFEKEYLKKFLQYSYWALFQQCLVLIPLHFIDLAAPMKFLIGSLIFSCAFHFPNKKLMIFTSIFAAVFYYGWFMEDVQSLIYLAVLHAFGGTAYYKLGWDMRVYRFSSDT